MSNLRLPVGLQLPTTPEEGAGCRLPILRHRPRTAAWQQGARAGASSGSAASERQLGTSSGSEGGLNLVKNRNGKIKEA